MVVVCKSERAMDLAPCQLGSIRSWTMMTACCRRPGCRRSMRSTGRPRSERNGHRKRWSAPARQTRQPSLACRLFARYDGVRSTPFGRGAAADDGV